MAVFGVTEIIGKKNSKSLTRTSKYDILILIGGNV
jgi:hypothetical protein